MSIQDMYNNIKRFLATDIYFYTVLIILVGVLSFGLGRWSIQTTLNVEKPHVVLTTQPASAVVSRQSQDTPTQPDSLEMKLVASKKGTKYHLLTCPGAKQMNEENKIYFATEEEAKASGYTPAANCEGL